MGDCIMEELQTSLLYYYKDLSDNELWLRMNVSI